METLVEARQFLRDNWQDGVDCPCCRQNVKLYKHRLNFAMAKALIDILKAQQRLNASAIHVQRELNPRNGDYAKLRHWGLLESTGERSDDGNSSALWSITQKGREFVYGAISVPERAYLFDSKCFGFSVETITIQEALGKKFDYQELLNG